jgi:hypothetical protein
LKFILSRLPVERIHKAFSFFINKERYDLANAMIEHRGLVMVHSLSVLVGVSVSFDVTEFLGAKHATNDVFYHRLISTLLLTPYIDWKPDKSFYCEECYEQHHDVERWINGTKAFFKT